MGSCCCSCQRRCFSSNILTRSCVSFSTFLITSSSACPHNHYSHHTQEHTQTLAMSSLKASLALPVRDSRSMNPTQFTHTPLKMMALYMCACQGRDDTVRSTILTSDLSRFPLKIHSFFAGSAVGRLLVLQSVCGELEVEVGSRGSEGLQHTLSHCTEGYSHCSQ